MHFIPRRGVFHPCGEPRFIVGRLNSACLWKRRAQATQGSRESSRGKGGGWRATPKSSCAFSGGGGASARQARPRKQLGARSRCMDVVKQKTGGATTAHRAVGNVKRFFAKHLIFLLYDADTSAIGKQNDFFAKAGINWTCYPSIKCWNRSGKSCGFQSKMYGAPAPTSFGRRFFRADGRAG